MFTIIKTVSGVWYHLYNNGATKVHLSDFDVIIDAIAETYVIEAKNGSNIPSKAISISDIRVIDDSVSTTIPIAFSGATGLIELLTSLGYPPYLSNAPSQPPVKVYTKGQTAFFTNITQAWIDANFDNTGLGILEAIGWEKVPQLDGKVPIGQTTGGLFDNIGNSYGFANTVLVAHEADSAVFSDGKKGVNALGTGATVSGYVLVEDAVTAKTVKTSKVGQDHTGAPSTVETGANKNYQPSLIVLYVRRTEDLWITGGGSTSITPNLTQVLAIDNKTNDIPIVSNNGDGYLYVNDEQTILGNDVGGTKKIVIYEDTFMLESTVRIDIQGKGINMNTTTDGFLMPRVTTSQMNAIDVLILSESLLVYNTTESKFYQYNGTEWVVFGSNEYEISTAKIINRCPDNAFRNAHGNVKVGDVQYYATTTTPAKVLRFPNPNDLSDFTFEDFDSSFGWFLYMCHDEVNGKIYVPANLNRIIVFNDITDLSDYTVETITLTGGAEFSGSAPIETDGSFIYLGTAQTPLSRFIKIDLTDFSVTEIVDWVGAGSAPRGVIHSCAWNADKSKLYFANQATDYETGFAAEVNASDMTYTEFLQGTEGTTDDIAYIPYILGGGISFNDFLVLPQEFRGPGTPGCYVVDLVTKVRYPLQTMPATGVYWYQDDTVDPVIELLYVCGKDGFVQVFTGENLLKSAMNLENPELMYDLYVEKNGNWINEIVRIGNKIFGTIWNNALTDEKGALVELELIKVNTGAISKIESVYNNQKSIKVVYQESVSAVNYIDISGANGGSWNELLGDYVPKFTAFNEDSASALTGSWISNRSSLGFRLNFASPVTADLDYRIVIEP